MYLNTFKRNASFFRFLHKITSLVKWLTNVPCAQYLNATLELDKSKAKYQEKF